MIRCSLRDAEGRDRRINEGKGSYGQGREEKGREGKMRARKGREEREGREEGSKEAHLPLADALPSRSRIPL